MVLHVQTGMSFKNHKCSMYFMCLFMVIWVVIIVYPLGLLLSGYAWFTSAFSFSSVTTAITFWCRITLLVHFAFPKVY